MNASNPQADLGKVSKEIDRVDELISLFFDDALSEADFTSLNTMLLEDPTARERLHEMAQLHADLNSFFNQPEASKSALPGLPVGIPVGEGSTVSQ